MCNRERSLRLLVIAALAIVGAAPGAQAQQINRAQVLAAMKKATTFMVDKVAYKGGYVWSYLPDMTRRWGEMEATPTMIWIQPPGTPVMGHLFLDAYHATGDEYYYRAAEQVAGALMFAQHPSGGWNYIADFSGEGPLRKWYDTIGKNAWRLEEFQHYYGNATFDDAGTAESAKFFLRLFLEKRDAKYRVPLDKAIKFVVDSQYPIGLWPQRFPRAASVSLHGLPDYTGYATFNDDVAGENMDFLLRCYQALGDERLLDPIVRGMNAFLVTQLGPPQPGWGLQHTLDLLPAGARTYEPKALVTHTSATNLELLIRFYRLTGETKFLARIPEAIDWLEKLALPAGIAPAGRTHPQDGMAFYILEYANGLRAIGLDNCYTWVDHNIQWRVEGTEGVAKGTIGWPDYPAGSPSTIEWTTREADGEWQRPRWEERWFPQAFKGTMGQLMRAVQEDAEPAISGRTTLGTMTLVEAAYRAAEQGRSVELKEIRDEFGIT
jgi:hypothetical protein